LPVVGYLLLVVPATCWVFGGLDLGQYCGFRVLGLGVAELFEELCGEALFLFYLGFWG
jgi:hypothetical protein